MKKKRSLRKAKRAHRGSSNSQSTSETTPVNSDLSMEDATKEPTAYEALLLGKNGGRTIETEANQGKVPGSAGSKKKEKANDDVGLSDNDELVSNDINGSAAGKQIDEVNDMNESAKSITKVTEKKARRGLKRKRKSANGEELVNSAKASKEAHSDGNVFTTLLTREYFGPEEMHTVEKRKSGKKSKKKQKRIQKIVVDGKIVDYLDGGQKKEDEPIIITDPEDVEYLESAESDEQEEEEGKDEEIEKEEEDEEIDEEEEGEEIDEEEDDVVDYEDGGDAPKIANQLSALMDDEAEGIEIDAKPDSLIQYGTKIVYRDVQETVVDFEKKPFTSCGDSVQNGLNAFQWLIHPYDIKKFSRTVFQQRALCIARENKNYYGNLFSTAKFIDILQKEYVEYGTNVNVAVYKNQQRSTLNGIGKVYPLDIQRHIQEGCSIQFTNPQSFCDSVWYYCDLLQEVFGCFVGANTYMTPASTAGFAPHWDDIDAFLLQLEGRKHWKVYEPIEDELLPRLPSDNFTDDDMADRTVVFDGWLEQGDLLYIPRGFIHQGFADKFRHSLHLTVSVCRNVTYADLLEHVIPQAVADFAEQDKNLRKSLPIGYLDMTGVLDCKYPLVKTGDVKIYGVLDNALAKFRDYMCQLNESAVDMMAREFMRTALPPVLTEEEKSMTALCLAGSSVYENKRRIFTMRTKIKLLRKHGQRLIYESEERCFIVHRMANSKVYEGRPEILFDLDMKLVKGFANLVNKYPKWCFVEDLKCDTAADNVRLASLLYSHGLLMARFPN